MFHKTRLKLTSWYLIIIMSISIFFSLLIYLGATNEFDRALRLQQYTQLHPDTRTTRVLQRNLWELDDILPDNLLPDAQLLDTVRIRTLETLIGINLVIFIFSSFAGYFLAGKTLDPIKEMVEDQNRFITDSSHELRTPITSLRSEIEVTLRDKKLDLAKAKKTLKSNLEEVIGLQSLSDNLLELSKNGTLVSRDLMKNVSAKLIVDLAIKKVSGFSRDKKIKIESKVADRNIKCVKDRLIEVFVILLDNSIKHSKARSTITIDSVEKDINIQISVTDRGSGIVSKDIPYIFDRFYRSDNSRSKDGYGLGLSIAKKIVESHGGKIDVESIPNEKTVFTVAIPS